MDSPPVDHGLIWPFVKKLRMIGVLQRYGQTAAQSGRCLCRVVRNVPLLVQLFIWYFVLPNVPGLGMVQTGIKPVAPAIHLLCGSDFSGRTRGGTGSTGINALGSDSRWRAWPGAESGQVYQLILLRWPTESSSDPDFGVFEYCQELGRGVDNWVGRASRQSQQLGEFTAHWVQSFIAVTLPMA
jgi:hypothetical protein